MKDTHGVWNLLRTNKQIGVLILIVMKDTHGAYHVEHDSCYYHVSLNPYCNERYSWRLTKARTNLWLPTVLILIVMKDTHGALLSEKTEQKVLKS